MPKFHYPRTWTELRALPRMRPEPVSRDVVKLGQLASPPYGMAKSDGESKCGIAECPATHRHGFVIELADQTLTHVGKDCAKSQIGKTIWGRMTSTFSRQFGSMAQAKAAFESRRDAEPKVAAQPLAERGDVVEVLDLLRAFDAAPNWFRQAIEGRAIGNDKDILELHQPSQREVDEARRHAKGKIPPPRLVKVAEIQGLLAFKQQNRVDRLVLERHPAVIRDLATTLSNPTAKARDIKEATNRVDEVEKLLSLNSVRIRRFFTQENLVTLLRLQRLREQGIRQIKLLGGAVSKLDFS